MAAVLTPNGLEIGLVVPVEEPQPEKKKTGRKTTSEPTK